MIAAREQPATVTTTDLIRRIGELKDIPSGWHEGIGLALSSNGLDWLQQSIQRSWRASVPLPYLFPTPEGNVLAEWSLGPWSPSIEIDLASRQGIWHVGNAETDEEHERTIDLSKPESWNDLAADLTRWSGDAA